MFYFCYYGFWQSEEQEDEGLTRLSEREQLKAIESQLKFRKQVLKQMYKDAKIFSFSKKNEAGKYIKHSLADLRSNLLVLIKATMTMQSSIRKAFLSLLESILSTLSMMVYTKGM